MAPIEVIVLTEFKRDALVTFELQVAIVTQQVVLIGNALRFLPSVTTSISLKQLPIGDDYRSVAHVTNDDFVAVVSIPEIPAHFYSSSVVQLLPDELDYVENHRHLSPPKCKFPIMHFGQRIRKLNAGGRVSMFHRRLRSTVEPNAGVGSEIHQQ